MENVELVMPGKTRPARHEGVVTIANRVAGDVAKIRARSRSRLLRHLDRLISGKEDQLRVVNPVRLKQDAVPGWSSRTGWKHRTRRVVAYRGAGGNARIRRIGIDKVAIALSKPRAVPAVLCDNGDVGMLTEVELADEAFAVETLVPCSRTRNRRTPAGKPSRGSQPEHGIEANPVHPQFAGVKCLTGGEEPGIRVGAVGQADLAVVRTEQRRRVPSAIIVGMPHHLDAELVVAHLSEGIAITNRNEVVELVDATVAGERQDALFREQVVEFKLTELDVQPCAAKQVIQPSHDGFKMKGGGGIGGREHVEGKVFLQRAAGVEVEAAEIETRRSDPLLYLAAAAAVDGLFALADSMPDGNDAERDRPVSRILPDWRVAIIHELVAVVFELLAEEIQHGPAFMTGGATQAVLPGESR